MSEAIFLLKCFRLQLKSLLHSPEASSFSVLANKEITSLFQRWTRSFVQAGVYSRALSATSFSLCGTLLYKKGNCCRVTKLETPNLSLCCAVTPCSSLGLMAPNQRQILRFLMVWGSVLSGLDCPLELLLQAAMQRWQVGQPISPVVFTWWTEDVHLAVGEGKGGHV